MPHLTALTLDRANEWLVRRRLSGRLPPYSGPSPVDYLASLGDGIHPPPESMEALEPVHAGGRRWEASSPWPGAADRNGRWIAERYPPRGVEATQPPTGRAPAVILLHGWLMDSPQLAVYRSWARAAAACGMDVWMPRLPYHLERAEPGEVSGQRCLSPDLGTSLDAVRQGVAEVRVLAAWLRHRSTPSVGVWGMSLGGWVAALAATLESRWGAVALWAPVASPAEVLFESKLVELLRAAVVDGGISELDPSGPEIGAMSPERRRTAVARERVLIVAGMYDQVISPRSIIRMARTWNADVRWVPHGHISLMASRAPIHDTVAFFRQTLRKT